ncbi:MAG: GTPase ObgE [Bacilli bacterium]|nr:GTPase ObgE [Bacilli bacterium]
MFIDRTIIEVRSGKGGDGSIAFRHEKNVPKGGPSGGNGGRGGSIYLRASKSTTTLVNYRHSRVFIADDGEKGDIKLMYGRGAKDVYIDLPIGTVVFLEENHQFLCDLTEEGQTFLVAKGGRGGRGNAAFKNARIKAPKIAENGLPGERKRLILELKLLADVGIIGLPSVGKSTFISCVTNCDAEIGDYDFTTIVPNLGVAKIEDESFVLADMPGLIEGAHLGKGLGLMFLRHIERCRVLIHMIDMSGERDPYEDYLTIRKELDAYGMHLSDRPEIIVASKMDEEGAEERLAEFKAKIGDDKDIIPISSIAEQNLNQVLYRCVDLLKTAPTFSVFEEKDQEKVYDLNEEAEIFEIVKVKDHIYEIKGDRVERTYNLINISTDEGMMRLITYLNKIGVDKKLHEIGAKDGDTVRLCDFEFDYFE